MRSCDGRGGEAGDADKAGLHVAGVSGVVNFDAAKNAETHVHRIGRTGRLGPDGEAVAGTAHTFIMPHEAGFAAALARNLQVRPSRRGGEAAATVTL